jgi:hypothetical protein
MANHRLFHVLNGLVVRLNKYPSIRVPFNVSDFNIGTKSFDVTTLCRFPNSLSSVLVASRNRVTWFQHIIVVGSSLFWSISSLIRAAKLTSNPMFFRNGSVSWKRSDPWWKNVLWACMYESNYGSNECFNSIMVRSNRNFKKQTNKKTIIPTGSRISWRFFDCTKLIVNKWSRAV